MTPPTNITAIQKPSPAGARTLSVESALLACYHVGNQPENLAAAAAQLAKSERGVEAMRGLLAWLLGPASGLDCMNQEAVLTLLGGRWGGHYGGTAVDVMIAALAGRSEPAD